MMMPVLKKLNDYATRMASGVLFVIKLLCIIDCREEKHIHVNTVVIKSIRWQEQFLKKHQLLCECGSIVCFY